MARIKKQFYRKGVDNQTVSDVTVDLKRPDFYMTKCWTVEHKILLKAFINDAEETFKTFIGELKSLAK